MGIYRNGKGVANIYYHSRPVSAVYVKGQKVWPDITIILSCYANGYWIDQNPWTDNTPWTEN